MVVAVMKGALICGKPAGFEVNYSARFFPVSSNGEQKKGDESIFSASKENQRFRFNI
jgi:hypothetical protein